MLISFVSGMWQDSSASYRRNLQYWGILVCKIRILEIILNQLWKRKNKIIKRKNFVSLWYIWDFISVYFTKDSMKSSCFRSIVEQEGRK